MSEGLAWLMVGGVLLWLMGAAMLALALWDRPARRRARAAALRAAAQKDRAHAAVLRAQRAQDRGVAREGRRTRKGAPWSAAGMNAFLLLLLLAPAADRVPYSML